MSDLQSLLLVIAAIYLAECLVWLPLGTLAFSAWWPGRWRLRQPGEIGGNARGGFQWAHPLPPLGTVIYGRQLPLSFSPDGVCSWNPVCLNGTRRPLQVARHFHFDDIREVATRGAKVFVNGREFLKTNSESYAHFLVQNIRGIQRLPRAERTQAIARLYAAQFDSRAVRERMSQVLARCQRVRDLANLLFVSMFMITPLVIWKFGWSRFLWELVIGLLGQAVLLALLYRRAHQALLPAATEERFTWFLTMLLAVPTAMRAHDILARRTFEQFHPLALARVLCSDESFARLARSVARDWRYPIEPALPGEGADCRRIVEWSQQAWREAGENFLRETELKLDELIQPPVRSEACHTTYCPRCHAQFVLAEGVCVDCGGRRLASFPVASTARG